MKSLGLLIADIMCGGPPTRALCVINALHALGSLRTCKRNAYTTRVFGFGGLEWWNGLEWTIIRESVDSM